MAVVIFTVTSLFAISQFTTNAAARLHEGDRPVIEYTEANMQIAANLNTFNTF